MNPLNQLSSTYFDITGTVSKSFETNRADMPKTLQFDGALTLTHHGKDLVLPANINPLNQLSGSKRRPTFCRNQDFLEYLIGTELAALRYVEYFQAANNRNLFAAKRWFYHYFYFYLKARSIVDQTDNHTIKSAKHFKKCLRQAPENLRKHLESNHE